MSRISFYIFLVLKFLLVRRSNPPYWLLPILRFVLRDLIKYRKEVINNNIRRVFPEYSDVEVRDLYLKFYNVLCTIFIESIYAYSYPEELSKRVSFLNAKDITEPYETNRPIIFTSGHFINWEWIGMSFGSATEFPVFGIYKKLSNPYFNRYLIERRKTPNLGLVEMRETKRHMMRSIAKKLPCGYLLAADQAPNYLPKAVYVDFFNESTPFLSGIQQFSDAYDLSVYYCEFNNVKRGYYEVTIRKLEKVNGSYLQAFASAVESSIRVKPHTWLWSHRRWKHLENN